MAGFARASRANAVFFFVSVAAATGASKSNRGCPGEIGCAAGFPFFVGTGRRGDHTGGLAMISVRGVARAAVVGAMVLAAAFVGAVHLVAEPAHCDIQYPNFGSVDGLTFVGSTARVGDRLRLTPSEMYKIGAAWYTEKQRIDLGFDTVFRFQMTSGTGDGLAFVIQNERSSAMGWWGAALGYSSWPPDNAIGISHSLAVEFDTYQNGGYWGDPAHDHVSINSHGTEPNDADHHYSLACSWAIPTLADGSVHSARITYLPGNMSVYLDGAASPAVSVPVDLPQLLGLPDGHAWVGFTAGTGALTANEDILDWTLTETPEPATLSLLALGSFALLRHRRARSP